MTAPFDPAAWLAEANQIGVDMYLWPGPLKYGRDPQGEVPWGVWTELPRHGYDDRQLFRTLRGDPETAEANERALYAHMHETGRYGPSDVRSDLAALTVDQQRRYVGNIWRYHMAAIARSERARHAARARWAKAKAAA